MRSLFRIKISLCYGGSQKYLNGSKIVSRYEQCLKRADTEIPQPYEHVTIKIDECFNNRGEVTCSDLRLSAENLYIYIFYLA